MGVTKYIVPVLAGAVAGMILLSCGEWSIMQLYPMPPGIHQNNTVAFANYLSQLPAQAFVMIIVNYILCSFLAGLISSLVAKRISVTPALVVGIVLTFSGIYNAIQLPQPIWFSILSVLVFLPLSYLGYLVVRKKATLNAD